MRIAGMLLVLLSLNSIGYANDTISSNQNRHHKQILAENVPPGLQKKGLSAPPPFLGKTPPGWDEGVKKGWNKNSDWRWNKKTKSWQNKHWKWDKKTNAWKHEKGWK